MLLQEGIGDKFPLPLSLSPLRRQPAIKQNITNDTNSLLFPYDLILNDVILLLSTTKVDRFVHKPYFLI